MTKKIKYNPDDYWIADSNGKMHLKDGIDPPDHNTLEPHSNTSKVSEILDRISTKLDEINSILDKYKNAKN
ncbi:hypothetical protein DQT32_04590 [Salmonella enterica subsp. enterica serovar Braenderup]|nr:hypothetical protein [Salmonella enterica subsp. enterica serovar Braenderup]